MMKKKTRYVITGVRHGARLRDNVSHYFKSKKDAQKRLYSYSFACRNPRIKKIKVGKVMN